MIEIPAKIKRIGSKTWDNIKLRLPDSAKPYTDEYDLELVEYHSSPSIGIFAQKKDNPEEDVASCTVHNQNAGKNMAKGFKQIFERLKELSECK
jgi:hypothetical protein